MTYFYMSEMVCTSKESELCITLFMSQSLCASELAPSLLVQEYLHYTVTDAAEQPTVQN